MAKIKKENGIHYHLSDYSMMYRVIIIYLSIYKIHNNLRTLKEKWRRKSAALKKILYKTGHLIEHNICYKLRADYNLHI